MSALPLHLGGKVALVTGAAKGIGLETALELHRRGASVALVDLELATAERAARPLGERAIGLAADVTDRAALEAAVAATIERFGGIDVIVANAGIAPPVRPISALDSEVFERTVEVDLLGVYRTVSVALPAVIERRGHVVVVASVYAFVNGVLASPYAVSKAGVEQLGRALRAELSIHGASASVAYFGFIDTDMVRDALADPAAQAVQVLFPGFVRKRLSAKVAGVAIADGIERRAPRIIRPRWWRVASVLRGIVNPLTDRALESDERLRKSVRDAEALGRR